MPKTCEFLTRRTMINPHEEYPEVSEHIRYHWCLYIDEGHGNCPYPARMCKWKEEHDALVHRLNRMSMETELDDGGD